MNPLAELRAAVEAAATALRGDRAAPSAAVTLQRPKLEAHGDYATNAALLLAPVLGEQPRAIAERVGEELAERLGDQLQSTQVAGPGFLNLVLADPWYRAAVAHVLAAGRRFGGGEVGAPERILVEFVSANPTGPLTAASGRHAAYGDALLRILRFAGHEVHSEYYVNDYGSQVLRLGESIRARARGEQVPNDGYQGEYVRELAMSIDGAAEAEPAELAVAGVALMRARIERSLEAFGVHFDSWFSERSLHEGERPTAVQRAEAELEAGGHLYRSDEASWLRATTFGDDKDRVLRRADGQPTYLASDVAYHEHKRARSFTRLIDIWGSDHHGYVRRMQAAWQALGGDADELEIVIMQYVHLIEGGERAGMSKRRGDFITLDELVAEIGSDAARYFMVQRSHDTEMDLDLDLARSQSADNPVYYVQYAHARIASILEKAGAGRVGAAVEDSERHGRSVADNGRDTGPSLEPSERTLIRTLLAFPAEVAEAVERRAPHRIAAYALELAQRFTAFYRDCRVVGAEPPAVETFRLALSVATQQVLAQALGLLGVSAPTAM
ncbi:MAG: arginine--tRNA ligase [Solirubrobacteraceae bacterium]|nr:MAG: arginine--tRNA ligase [Solirubrobacterales bacterium]